MRAAAKLVLYRLLFFVAVAACLAAACKAKAEPVERPFNQLTSLVVSDDLRSVQLFGIHNPLGPSRAIPYDRLFADAFALPTESVMEGSPSFALDFTKSFWTQWPVIQRRLTNAETEFDAYINHNVKAHDAYVESALAQALEQAIKGVRAVFKVHGFAPRDIDDLFSTVHSIDDLKALVLGMQRAGVVRANDDLLNMSLKLAVDEFKTAEGNVFFYPEEVLAGYVGIPVQTEPHFYGINPHSQLARVMLEGDIALKHVVADNSLKGALSFHQTRLEWKFKNLSAEEIVACEPVISANIRPNVIALSASSDGRVIVFDREDLAIAYVPRDVRIPPSAADLRYSEFLTSHFSDYAREVEPLWMVRELYKIVAATRYLRAKGINLTGPTDNTWQPPQKVNAIWRAASGGTGKGAIERIILIGGVNLTVSGATSVTSMPSQRLEMVKAASAQLDSVFKSGGSGVCYDGQDGCKAGVPLGFIKIGGDPRGSASLSQDVLAKMRARPELGKLLDAEQSARTAWNKTQDDIREKQASLSTAKTPEDKGNLQVELSKALQKASNAKSALDTTQVKVEQGAKLIVEHK
jgi:hypothetical protein